MNGGSAQRIIREAIKAWSTDRVRHISLYYDAGTNLFWWFWSDGQGEAGFVRDHPRSMQMFRGSYWSFMDRCAVVLAYHFVEVVKDGVSSPFQTR